MKEIELEVIDRGGGLRRLKGHIGESLMRVLRDAETGILGTCGGAASCGTCHVVLLDEWAARLPPDTEDELDMLSSLGEVVDLPVGSRLSCQLVCSEDMSGLCLQIPPEL